MDQSTRAAALESIDSYFDAGRFFDDLSRRVGFRTESPVPEQRDELYRYLREQMVPAFEAMGFRCHISDNPVDGGGPFLVARRHEADDLPTVMSYAHGDVVRGYDDQWDDGLNPWELTARGDRLYGRGTADNKGQHTINMAGMNAVLQTRGQLGYNAKFIIEMAEENGSQGLGDVIAANMDAFKADVFVASDGPRVRPERPTLSLGARGGLNFDLVCDLREGGHHSGNWGGALADPVMILANALSSICGPTGQIMIPEWLPPAMSNAVRSALADVTLDPGPDGPVIDPDYGEPGMTTAEKVYGWNSFAVLAMVTGNPDAPVNAIQPFARANCQLRYIAGTDAEDILPALRRHLDAAGFSKVEVRKAGAENAAGFAASRTEPDNPWALFVRRSVERTAGQPPAVIPQMGGSICNDLFTDLLGLPAIWIPHSYAACSQHAPDEHILMSVTRTALPIMTGLYWDIGAGNVPEKS